MINLFSIIIGTSLFLELAIIVALLKPVRQPGALRDLWCDFKKRFAYPTKIIVLLMGVLFLSTLLEISWESTNHHRALLHSPNAHLILQFYASKISLCYICFFMEIYLIFVINWIAEFTIRVARLLEFELMCRHAVLTRDENIQQVSNTAIVLTNYESTFKAVSKFHSDSDDFLIKARKRQ